MVLSAIQRCWSRDRLIMTKTLVVTNDFPPRSGGIETFIHELLSRMDASSVAVFGPAHEASANYDRTLGYEVVRHKGAVLPTSSTAKRAIDVARATGCEQVLIASAMPVGMLVPNFSRAGLPTAVAMTHGNEAGWARVPGIAQGLRRISDAQFVTYLGDYTRSRIEPALRPGTRMRRLAPAVDAQRFNPSVDGSAIRARHGVAGRVVISCISRLVDRKGQDRLIQALPHIRRIIPEAVVMLVGDGPDRPRLEKMVRSLGIERHVVFTGRVADDELASYYAACDVFALPCRTQRLGIDVEGLGIVLLEASATGKPVIAGNSGGAPDAVRDGDTGVVVPDDARALANTIIDIVSDDFRAAAMGKAGRSWVLENWTWETPANRLKAMLAGVDPDSVA